MFAAVGLQDVLDFNGKVLSFSILTTLNAGSELKKIHFGVEVAPKPPPHFAYKQTEHN
tara:strand:+ start:6297 stop:6470 length:174 start_codon:yes stop_codon:yes gene_type:complete